LNGIRKEHARAGEAGAVIDQQCVGQLRRQPEVSGEAGEEFTPRQVSVSIELNQRLQVGI